MLSRRLSSFTAKKNNNLVAVSSTATPLLLSSFRYQQAFSVNKRSENGGASEGGISIGAGGGGGASSIAKNVAPLDYGAVPMYKKPPKMPVGTHLPVQHGGGTDSERDPFTRRKPNQPTRLPETSVLSGATAGSAVFTEEERMNPRLLSNRRLPVGEWLRKQFGDSSSSKTGATVEAINNSGVGNNSVTPQQGCPLLWYIQALALPYKPLGPAEQRIISNFEESTIPEVCQAQEGREASLEVQRWQHNFVSKFTDEFHLFSPEDFTAKLEKLRTEVLGFFGEGESSGYAEELESVFQILADNAKAIRNNKLKQLTAVVSSTVHEEGGLAWSRFFDVVERNKEKFQLTQDGKRLSMWMSSQDAATPVVSPALCLLFLAVTSLDTRQSAAKPHALLASMMSSSSNSNNNSKTTSAKDFIPSSSSASSSSDNHLWNLADQLLTREELFEFCHRHIDEFLGPMDAHVVRSLRQSKSFSDLASAVEAVSAGSSALGDSEGEKIIQSVLPAFENMTAVHSLVQRVMSMASSNNKSVSTTNIRAYITNLLQRLVDENSSADEIAAAAASASSSSTTATSTSALDLNPYFKSLQKHWENVSEQFARELLANRDIAQQISHSVATLNLSSGTAKTRSASNVLFEKKDTQDALRRLSSMYFEQKELAEQTLLGIKYQLLSRTENVTELAKLLISSTNQKLGTQAAIVLASEVEAMVKRRIEEKAVEPSRPDWFYKSAIDQVAAENPNWLKKEVGVIQPNTDLAVSPDPLLAHELLLRIYLRLTYVPHAANAVLKSHHRRRIGQIAKHKNQMNLEGEIGFVESYNTFEYKQWDWQGWYQRMLDVFHRNISIRVRVDDMRRLDNEGKPFVDLQTERRLRILGDDRVGSGMLKLDSDRFEDKSDNLDYGSGKMQQLLSEAKKAQLGPEYWPTVEVKVREPSGQSKMRYSTLDWERVEKKSTEMFEKYRKAKGRSIYVPPTETWLKLGTSTTATSSAAADVDEDGYTVDSLFSAMNKK